MSVFMIETGNVDSASSAVGKVASQVSDLSSSVSGYDTSCEDGFDFASAKNVIASNIEACVTKVKNTASILNTVSQTHTQLQSSLKYKEDESSTNSGGKSGGSSGSSYSGGGYSGGGGGGGYSSGGYSSAGSAAAAGTTAATTAALRKNDTTTKKTEEIENNFKEIGYVYIDQEKIDDNSKKIFEHEEFKYDEEGYAKIGDRYVVTVDESVGKVGDVLKFTQEDGTEIEVVVGLTTTGSKYKDKINFVMKTDTEINEETKKKFADLLKNTKKIEKVENILGLASGENSDLIENTMSEVGNTIADYPGQGFHDGVWCADFVSYTLQKNGYDVEWSSLAGDGDGTILGNLRNTGATVHLDLGAQAKGLQNSSEYDPSYSPQAGDVVIFDWELDGVNDHTGFVVKDNGDGTITTLEGNTSGEAGGSCVAIHTDRQRSNIYGYATPVKSNK